MFVLPSCGSDIESSQIVECSLERDDHEADAGAIYNRVRVNTRDIADVFIESPQDQAPSVPS